MTRHPSTEGNNLSPNRVDAKADVTVPDGEGGRRSFRNFSSDVNEQIEEIATELEFDNLRTMEGFAPGWSG